MSSPGLGCYAATVGSYFPLFQGSHKSYEDSLTLEDGTNRLSWNVSIVNDDPGSKPDQKYARQRDRQNYIQNEVKI